MSSGYLRFEGGVSYPSTLGTSFSRPAALGPNNVYVSKPIPPQQSRWKDTAKACTEHLKKGLLPLKTKTPHSSIRRTVGRRSREEREQ